MVDKQWGVHEPVSLMLSQMRYALAISLAVRDHQQCADLWGCGLRRLLHICSQHRPWHAACSALFNIHLLLLLVWGHLLAHSLVCPSVPLVMSRFRPTLRLAICLCTVMDKQLPLLPIQWMQPWPCLMCFPQACQHADVQLPAAGTTYVIAAAHSPDQSSAAHTRRH